MTTRMFPNPLTAGQPGTMGVQVTPSRFYTCAVGSTLDVPDGDVQALQGAGWSAVAKSGTTAQRPNGSVMVAGIWPAPGMLFLDTTVGKIICYDGVTWRDPANGNAV